MIEIRSHKLYKFIPDLFSLVVILMNGVGVLVQGQQLSFEVTDPCVVSMAKMRLEIEPHFVRMSMKFERVGDGEANGVKKSAKNHVFGLIPLEKLYPVSIPKTKMRLEESDG